MNHAFTRASAIHLVLCEGLAENGMGTLVGAGGEDPGTVRVDRTIAALEFLTRELGLDDSMPRDFVAALFMLATEVADGIGGQQGIELKIAAQMLIEQWDNWPDASKYSFTEPPQIGEVVVEQLGGYCAGDVTYCQIPETRNVWPVRVTDLARTFLCVEPLNPGDRAAEEFALRSELNCRFFMPRLVPGSRFGGSDERLVNSSRRDGPELRLLPTHYATTANAVIRELHAQDPVNCPLPTGRVGVNWFGKSAIE